MKEASTPSNKTELKSYLGIANFHGKYLGNLSTILIPLPKLLCKEVIWNWGSQQAEAFQKCKDMLQLAEGLVHFDPAKLLVLSCDTSPYGVGAVWHIRCQMTQRNQWSMGLEDCCQPRRTTRSLTRNSGYNLCSEDISPVPSWLSLHYSNGSQAITGKLRA